MRFTDFRINEAEDIEKAEEAASPKGPKTKEFDQTPLVKSAEKRLTKKFGAQGTDFTFKHVPALSKINKEYSASIDGKEFIIAGSSFDTNNDGVNDTVLYKILSAETAEAEPEAMF